MFLFQISGPEFLGWYTAFFALSCLVAFVLRSIILQVSSDAVSDGEIDQYDVAYLSGGSEQVYFCAIGTMSRIGLVTLDTITRELSCKETNVQLHPVEANLCSSIKWSGGKVDTTYSHFKPTIERIEQRLKKLKLVPSDERTLAAQLIPAATLLILPTFIGLPRLGNGLAQGHPTGFLMVLFVFSAFTALCVIFKKPYRTSLGAEAVGILQGKHEALKTNFQTCPSTLSTMDMTLGYALFGGVLVSSTDPFNLAKTALHPAATGGTGSCGGSGCGGGGCGGGCGGCGG